VATADRLLRKAVNTLAIVPTKERIPLLARKVYNVMIHYAQHQGIERDLYRAHLRDIVNGLEFNSHNTEVLKQHLRQMVSTVVEWQSPTVGEGARWSVSALIAHADLIVEKGEVVLEWSYARNIRQELLDPQRYARISLHFQAALKSTAALSLYEICCRYMDNPSGLTSRNAWGWWRPVLTGTPDSAADAYLEYKYFKRDVLKPAVAEISQVTDLEVELLEYKQGRAVSDVQFRVKKRAQTTLPLNHAPQPVDLKLIGEALHLGISQDKAERMLARYGDRALASALHMLRERRGRGGLEPVRLPAQFVEALLRAGAANPPAPKPVNIEDTKRRGRIALIERFRELRRGELDAMYKEMSIQDQETHLASFTASAGVRDNKVLNRTLGSKGLSSPLVKQAFIQFLGQQTWGAEWDRPSDTELLALATETIAQVP
jgi:hypothetical protein